MAALTIADGRLVGRSTTTMPLLHVEREADPADDDPLYAVEIRARASAGANLVIHFTGEKQPPPEQLADEIELLSWGRTPITPGEELVTYTLTSPSSI